MYYNFKEQDLKSDERVEEYKKFSQEVLANMETVAEVESRLHELNAAASMTVRMGNLDYKATSSRNITAKGVTYSADRLRQVIYASKRVKALAVNVQFQEGSGSKDDPYKTVADISFEYDPEEKSVNIGEVLDTQELEEIEQGIKQKGRTAGEDYER